MTQMHFSDSAPPTQDDAPIADSDEGLIVDNDSTPQQYSKKRMFVKHTPPSSHSATPTQDDAHHANNEPTRHDHGNGDETNDDDMETQYIHYNDEGTMVEDDSTPQQYTKKTRFIKHTPSQGV